MSFRRSLLSLTLVAAAVAGLPALAAAQAVAAPAGDAAFVHHAATDSMAEVALGRLAAQRASSPAVKQYGERLVADHAAANQELAAIAGRAGIALPTELDAEHRAAYTKLSALSGPEFDRAFMIEMMRDHQKAIQLFQQRAQGDGHPEISAFAARTLPVLQQHHAMAQQLHAQLAGGTGGAALPGAVAAPPAAVVVTPPGAVVVAPGAATVVPARPWCAGAFQPGGGTNFGACPR
jgi:putative membrane protein